MSVPDSAREHLIVAMPAFNEADGIVDFLSAWEEALADRPGPVGIIVVDDGSGDATAALVDAAARKTRVPIHLVSNAENLGHGPSTVRALKAAIDRGADLVVQVDGDGQFLPSEVDLLLTALSDGASAAFGVRLQRHDPWFRRALSRLLRTYVRMLLGVRTADPNCPFRAFRAPAVEHMLDRLPPAPMVPSIYMRALAHREGLHIAEVPVTHRSRLGSSSQGSTWGRRTRRLLIPRRLIGFVARALLESWRFRKTYRAG